LISICETLIGPAIQSKDKDNMLLAIECIGLLCLLDKELFQNYSKIFQTILTEEIEGEDTLREKIIALKSSVDSLIIHGIEAKTTLKL
jgi:Nuclear condensing complex subunits, C-term domain